jgi:hypothetical protein
MLLYEGVEAYKKEGPTFMQRQVAKQKAMVSKTHDSSWKNAALHYVDSRIGVAPLVLGRIILRMLHAGCRPKELRGYSPYIHCWRLFHWHRAGLAPRGFFVPETVRRFGCRNNFD